MDIEEVKTKKKLLRTNLIKLVEEFEEETGICAKHIHIRHEGNVWNDNNCMGSLCANIEVMID